MQECLRGAQVVATGASYRKIKYVEMGVIYLVLLKDQEVPVSARVLAIVDCETK
jgi:hypothetical protein